MEHCSLELLLRQELHTRSWRLRACQIRLLPELATRALMPSTLISDAARPHWPLPKRGVYVTSSIRR